MSNPSAPTQVVDARRFGYFRVDNSLFDQGLSVYALTVYMFLCRCANGNGMSFPSHALISKKTGIGRTRLKGALAELRENELLTWTSPSDYGVNTYTIMSPRDQGEAPHDQGVVATRLAPSRSAPTEGLPREGLPNEGPKLTTLSGKPDDAHDILNFLNRKADRNYQSTVNVDLIRARLRAGATIYQCKAVISRKVRAWKGTDMDYCLRPKTLFNATNFAQYLGELPATMFSPEEEESHA